MRICIVGAGAIGGWIGTRLAATRGVDVSAVARGPVLEALQRHGWRLKLGDDLIQNPAVASHDPGTLGAQDVVVLAVKTPALAPAAHSIEPLLGPDTFVVPLVNGVPWWFGHGTPLGSRPLTSVDPDGTIAKAIPADRVVGAVVHVACSAPAPGLATHIGGNQLYVGEIDGTTSSRVNKFADHLTAAGIDAAATERIRDEIWYKLWGNMTMNPVSALTGATLNQVLADPLVRSFCSEIMIEAAAIGARLGCVIDESPDERHRVTSKLGSFRTSMLQDVDAGRPIELDALLGAVYEIGQRLDVPTPLTAALFGLTRLFAETRGLY